MGWSERCISTLDAEKLFENSGHLTRFKELMDCYSSYPFFTKGLCKCMYLSAWDEEHFAILLETLNDMSLGKERDTSEMEIKGDALAEEQTDGEYYVYELSLSFLSNTPYAPGSISSIPPTQRYIISRALEAARIIDGLEFQ